MRSRAGGLATLGIVPSLAMPGPARTERPPPELLVRRRLQALAMDCAILAVGYSTSLLLLSVSGARVWEYAGALAALLATAILPAPVPDWAGPAALAVALWPLLAVPYYALSEGLFGATAGKRMLGLSVSTHPGSHKPGVRRALVRAVLRPVDALFFGLVGFVASRIAGDGRRLGDLAAGTVVRPARPGSPIAADVEAQKVRVGLEAERAVRKVLAPLADEGYYVFFNVEHRHLGDIDALVIGPEGVAVVEVEGHKGFVSVHPETGDLLRDGAPFETDVLAQVHRQSDQIAGALGLYRGAGDDPMGQYVHTPLQPWLVFTRAELVRSGRGDFPPEASTLAALEHHFRTPRPGDTATFLDPRGARELALRIQKFYSVFPIAPRGYRDDPDRDPKVG